MHFSMYIYDVEFSHKVITQVFSGSSAVANTVNFNVCVCVCVLMVLCVGVLQYAITQKL